MLNLDGCIVNKGERIAQIILWGEMHFQGGALRACIAFERGSFISGGVHAFRGSFDMILVTCAGCVELLPLLEVPAFDSSFGFARDRC